MAQWILWCLKQHALRRVHSVLILASVFVLLPFHGHQTLSTAPLPQIWNVPQSNPTFVGRKTLLQALYFQLHAKNSPHVALVGLPGIGKTQLIKRYAHQHASEYTIIWWFDCSKDLTLQFINFAEAWNRGIRNHKDQLPKEALTPLGVVPLVKDCLRRTHHPWLLVFDDCKTFADIRPYLPAPQQRAGRHILMSSKNAHLWRTSMKVEKFERSESLTLLKSILVTKDKKELDKLANVVGDYPLALSWAAAHIRAMPTLTIDAYIELFKKKRELLRTHEKKLQAMGSDNEAYNNTLASAFELTLDELQSKNPIAYEALCFIAFINPSGITQELIQAWLNKRGYPHDAIHEVFFDLTARLLLDPVGSQESPTHKVIYNTHEVVQILLRDRVPSKKHRSLIKEAAEILLSFLQGASSTLAKFVQTHPEIYEHAKALCRQAYDEEIMEASLMNLKINLLHLANYHQHEVDYVITLGRELEKEIKQGSDLDPFMRARYLNTLSNAVMWDDMNVAIQRAEEAVKILQTLRGPAVDEELVWAILMNLGDYYFFQGDLTKTLEAVKTIKPIIDRLDSNDYKAIYTMQMAICAHEKGRDKEALDHINKTLQLIEQAHLPTTNLIFAQTHKTEILARLGDYSQALIQSENLYKQALEIFQTPRAHIPIRLRFTKAFCLLGLSRLDRAKEEITAALEDHKASLGSTSHQGVDEALMYLILGEIVERQNDLQTALKHYKAADAIYTERLVKKELDDISRLYTRLAILGVKLNDPSITRTYLHHHIQHFGRNHPRTAEIAKYCDDHRVPVPW